MRIILCIYLAFVIASWIILAISIINVPSDIELWGEEIE